MNDEGLIVLSAIHKLQLHLRKMVEASSMSVTKKMAE
jgi:hypothetical protein